MSFDPFQEKNPPRDPAPRPALDSASANNPVPGGVPLQPVKPVRDRVLFPAVLLIVSGVINLLVAGNLVFSSVQLLMQTPEQMIESAKLQREALGQIFPGLKKAFEDHEKAGGSLDDEMSKAKPLSIGLSVASLLVALLTLFAGVRMLQLRNYGLVMIGSLLSAIPCVSGASCPCCVGAVAGIYSVILLLQPDIRDAFR